jgi:hypothetical protein
MIKENWVGGLNVWLGKTADWSVKNMAENMKWDR